MTITRTLALAYMRWSDAIAAARAEYHLHPTAACAATTACDDLARDGSRYCRRHRSNDPAARKRREEKKP